MHADPRAVIWVSAPGADQRRRGHVAEELNLAETCAVSGRANCLLPFHYKLSISYDKRGRN